MGDNLMARKTAKRAGGLVALVEKRAKKAAPKAKTRKPRQKITLGYIDSLPLSKEQKAKRESYRDLAGDWILGDKQFYTWYRKQPKAKIKTEALEDKNITLIKDALIEIKKKNPTFRIQRDGYLLKAGRAKKGEPPKFLVEPAPETKA